MILAVRDGTEHHLGGGDRLLCVDEAAEEV